MTTPKDAYDLIDRFLRNNLGDDDYAEYSAALEMVRQPQATAPPKEASMAFEWALAQWCLAIWDPDKVNFLVGKRRRQVRLYYRASGVVTHDRALNGEPIC